MAGSRYSVGGSALDDALAIAGIAVDDTPAVREMIAAARQELQEMRAELARVDDRISDAVADALREEDEYRSRNDEGCD